MRTIIFAAALVASSQAMAGWDPGGNTPPNATAINRAAHVSQPIEPKSDTTRESMIHATGNGGM